MKSYRNALRLQNIKREMPSKVCLASEDGQTTAGFTERHSNGEYQKMKNQPKPVPVQVPPGAETNLSEMLNRDRINTAKARRNLDG